MLEFIGGAVKKHLSQILCAAILVVMAVFFGNYMQSGSGKIAFDHFLGTFPFIKFMVNLVQKVTGLNVDLQTITESSVILDFTKLLVSTVIKAAFFALLSLIFLHLPRASAPLPFLGGLARGEWIDDAEKAMDGPWYKIKECIVGLVSVLLGTFVSNLVMDWLLGFVAGFTDAQQGIIGQIFLFLGVYVVCSLLFALVSSHSFSFSLAKTALFNILPEALSMFVTNTLLIACHLLWLHYGWGKETIGGIATLLLWCGLSQFLVKQIQRAFVAAFSDSLTPLGLVKGILWTLATVDAILVFYMLCVNTVDAADILTRNLGQFPFVAQLRSGASLWAGLNANPMEFGANLWPLFFVCLVMSTLQMLPQQLYVRLSHDIVIWLLMLGLCFCIVLVGYALADWVAGFFRFLNLAGVLLILILLVVLPQLVLESALATVLSLGGLTLLQRLQLCVNGSPNFAVLMYTAFALIVIGLVVHLFRRFLPF